MNHLLSGTQKIYVKNRISDDGDEKINSNFIDIIIVVGGVTAIICHISAFPMNHCTWEDIFDILFILPTGNWFDTRTNSRIPHCKLQFETTDERRSNCSHANMLATNFKWWSIKGFVIVGISLLLPAVVKWIVIVNEWNSWRWNTASD